ncbi:Nuclear segregation protein HuBFR1 [Hanseniaspora uvarum DSM 2768]|nr:Nuclear segregation protein HuBFR1 [Hanseniaspora uvarum DSM 2768]
MSTKQTTFIKRPDEASRDKKLQVLNTQLKKLSTEIASVTSEIDTKLGKNDANSSSNDELKEVIKQQNDLKLKRNVIFEQLKQIDSKIKASNKNIDIALASASSKAKDFKSIGEVDKEISFIENKLDQGGLSLVDEKRYIKQQSELNKIKKSLISVQPLKSEVYDLKQQQISLKNTLNKELDNKHLQKQFEAIQSDLNDQRSLKNKNQQIVNQLFNKRTALRAKRDEVYNKITETRNQFDNEFKAYKLKRELQKKQKDNEYKFEKLYSQKESDLTKLKEDILIAQNTPALMDDLNNIEFCLSELNPSYVKTAKAENVSTDNKKIVSRRKNRAPPVLKTISNELKSVSKKILNEEDSPSASSDATAVEISLSVVSIAVLGQYGLPVPDTTNKELISEVFDKLSAIKDETKAKSEALTIENIQKAQDRLQQVEELYVKREQELKDSIAALTIEDDKE